MIKILCSNCKNYVINVGKKWTLQISILQYLVLVLKLTLINKVSLITVFLIPQNQCYPRIPCTVGKVNGLILRIQIRYIFTRNLCMLLQQSFLEEFIFPNFFSTYELKHSMLRANYSKSQIISEWLVDVLNFSKKFCRRI